MHAVRLKRQLANSKLLMGTSYKRAGRKASGDGEELWRRRAWDEMELCFQLLG